MAAYLLIRFYPLPAILFHKETIRSFWETFIVQPLAWTRDFLSLYKCDEQGECIWYYDPGRTNPVHTEIGRPGYHVQSRILGLADDHTLAHFGRDPAGFARNGGYVVVGFYWTVSQAPLCLCQISLMSPDGKRTLSAATRGAQSLRMIEGSPVEQLS